MLSSFAYADSFLERVRSLPNETKKLVYRKVAEFCAAPDAPGFNAETLSGRARANGWRSARVDRDLRLIYGQIENTIVFSWVDRHDDAYSWADRNRLRVHPRTGSAQRYVVPEAILYSHRKSDQFAAPASTTAQANQQQIPQPAAGSPFQNEDNAYLLGIGVPEEWVPRVKALTSPAALEALIGCLPDEAWERLVDLANGHRPAPPVAQVGESLPDPLQHPDSRRRFVLLSNDAELAKALSDSWDTWQVFLHPSQRAAVETSHRGSSLVSGAAGTGKSIVIVHRAAWIARRLPAARILLTSYSKTLAARLSQQIDRLLVDDPAARGRIEVSHLDKRLMDFARLQLGTFNVANRAQIQPLLDMAARDAGLSVKDPGFLWAEWETVVDAWGIASLEPYLDVPREGRGLALPPAARRRVWPVFAATIDALARRRLRTWSGIAREVADALESRAARPYTHVIADESQDLGPSHLRFLRALAPEGPDHLTLAADTGQRIYRRPFSWLSAGIDIRGRSSRLRVSYRSTQQILAVADGVVTDAATNEGNETVRDAVALRSGPKPERVKCTSLAEEAEVTANWIKSCIEDGVMPGQIAIFARTNALLERVGTKAARRAGVACAELKEDRSPSVTAISLGTMHRAKGLEFRAVAVVGCSQNTLPLESIITGVRDLRDRDLIELAERQLLYVSLTRARDYLLVTWTGTVSPYLRSSLD